MTIDSGYQIARIVPKFVSPCHVEENAQMQGGDPFEEIAIRTGQDAVLYNVGGIPAAHCPDKGGCLPIVSVGYNADVVLLRRS
jgi:hypothetical protein